MSTRRHPMVVAAARELSRRNAEACGTDAEDEWKFYGESHLADAQDALDACGALDVLQALDVLMHEVIASGNADAKDFGWPNAVKRAKAALTKANGEA